jgi:hypothetical protein
VSASNHPQSATGHPTIERPCRVNNVEMERRAYFRQPPRRNGLVLAAAVGLNPLTFVQMSEKDNSGTADG